MEVSIEELWGVLTPVERDLILTRVRAQRAEQEIAVLRERIAALEGQAGAAGNLVLLDPGGPDAAGD